MEYKNKVRTEEINAVQSLRPMSSTPKTNQFLIFIFNLWKVSYFSNTPSRCVLIFDEMHNL